MSQFGFQPLKQMDISKQGACILLCDMLTDSFEVWPLGDFDIVIMLQERIRSEHGLNYRQGHYISMHPTQKPFMPR